MHSDGEIWAQTLWDLRHALGSVVAESLVTRAMELSPANPSFLDERNSILQADQAVFGGGNHDTIWRVFAHRGMGFFAAATDGDDVAPVENFTVPPAPNSPKGALTGTIRDRQTGQPIDGAVVAFGGHASGFPGDYADTTGSAGRYRIGGVFVGTYPKVKVAAPGYVPVQLTVTIGSGTTERSFRLLRDWAAANGGARVRSFTGPDFTGFGCGPGAAIDLSLGTGWGSTSDLTNGKPGPDTAKNVVVALPRAINIGRFAVDPANTCGDAASASTADFRIDTSKDGKKFVTAASGTFGPEDGHRLNLVTPKAGTANGVRYVRFWMLTPLVFDIGGSCPGNFSGCDFLDMSELEVYAAG